LSKLPASSIRATAREAGPARWFARDAQFGARCADFLDTHHAAARGAHDPPRDTRQWPASCPRLAGASSWTGAPPGTKSFVLIVDDPDAPDPAAPKMTWVHWVLYNVPASATGLPEAIKSPALPAGPRAGGNDWGETR